ncbi:colicin immunity domain-containing protein [Streptomyces sp. ITFR-6]|uniref:colicin immunity domain-containing protein n=1 Tax=Streptomyces sp. ITFR-6 TaxID=3075197 RepID=UPI00288A9BD4|nr:colicin immunity domain-containing protein [Streptomyces sp. ITFR-6]WNI30787.1 colicin immunity domain-containing protein [Streptomyces sp. ITFR-6]
MTDYNIPGEANSDQLGILSSLGDYNSAWLAVGAKLVVPVPAGSRVDDALVQRITEGCRTGGADAVLMVAIGSETACRTWRPIAPDIAASELVGFGPPLLLASSDRQGAILFPRPGYVLVAGTAGFLKGAVPEGVDGGRARFGRYVRTAAKRWPELKDISQSFSPRHIAWARAREIPAGTGAARQVNLMQAFTAGSISGADFARGWLDARRTSQDNGERLRDPLLTAFDQIFSLLEDYSIDPALKDPDDLSDEELMDAVRKTMERTDGF